MRYDIRCKIYNILDTTFQICCLKNECRISSMRYDVFYTKYQGWYIRNVMHGIWYEKCQNEIGSSRSQSLNKKHFQKQPLLNIKHELLKYILSIIIYQTWCMKYRTRNTKCKKYDM